jgi:hypothetical protein
MMIMEDRVKPEDITKWLDKLEARIPSLEPADDKAKEMLENIRAYVKDCRHFLLEGKLVLAFECMLWAHAVYETCSQLGLFEEQ